MKEIIKVSKANPNGDLEGFTPESVSVVAVNKMYMNRPFYAVPIWSQRHQRYMFGVVDIKQADMSKAEYVIDKETSVPINNGDVLRLYVNNKGEYLINRDLILYNLLLIQPEIAPSKSEVKNGTTLFYINNIERQAAVNTSIRRKVASAYAKLGQSTTSDFQDLLYFFNLNPKSYTMTVIESKCYDYAETQPDAVLAFFDKRQFSDRIVFVKKCLANKLLLKDKNGYILYDNIGIGLGEEAAANYLYDQANDRIYTALRGSLDALEGFQSV